MRPDGSFPLEVERGRGALSNQSRNIGFLVYAADIAASAGAPAPRIRVLGPGALRALGLVAPMLRELSGTSYQFTAPFVVDASATVDRVGWGAQDWDETVGRVVHAARAATTAGAR